MDDVNRIIGYAHADADIDELDTLKESTAAAAFRAIVARNREMKPSGEVNTVGVTTTPEGFKFVYKTWKKDPLPGFELIQAPTSSNPHLPDDYVDNLRAIYPNNLLTAYLNGEFVNLTQGTVYNGYNRDTNQSKEEITRFDHLMVGMDFNVTNMSAVIFVNRGGVYHAVHELTGIYDTPNMIHTLKTKWPDHNIAIYPDASGASRKTVNASISDITLLESAGLECRAPKKNPFIKDRVMAANAAFESCQVMVNSDKCPELASSLEQLCYDNNGMPDKTSGLDHLIDAATYPIAFELPIIKPIAAVPFKFAI